MSHEGIKKTLMEKKEELYRRILDDWDTVNMYFPENNDVIKQKSRAELYAELLFEGKGDNPEIIDYHFMRCDFSYDDIGTTEIVKSFEVYISGIKESSEKTKSLWNEVYALESTYKEMTTSTK